MIKENVDKEVMKDIFLEFFKINLITDSNYFSIEFNNDRSFIIYKDTIQEIYGQSCWEDSERKERYLTANEYNYYHISEMLNEFFNDIEKVYGKNYWDSKSFDIPEECFNVNEQLSNVICNEDTTNEDYDYYNNYNVVREYTIDINKFINMLYENPLAKDLDEILKIFNNISNDDESLQIKLKYLDLINSIPENNNNNKSKNKI